MSSRHYSNVDQLIKDKLILDNNKFLTEIMVPGFYTCNIIHHEGNCENRFTSK